MKCLMNRIGHSNHKYMRYLSNIYPCWFCSSTAESSGLSLKATPEYAQIPYNAEANKFLFMTTLSAPLIDTQKRSAIDLVCVLDESGSMDGAKIELVKDTMKFIVSNLTSNDRFGCIGYDSNVRVISSMKAMSSSAKQDTLKSIDLMRAGSLTALSHGLETGVNMMREIQIDDLAKSENSKNRVKNICLLTDGQANVGWTDPKEIIRAITDREFAELGRKKEEEQHGSIRRRSTSKLKAFVDSAAKWIELSPNTSKDKIYKELPCNIDTFGFGEYHDANFLTMLSEYGRGLYTFVSSEEDIAGTFGEVLGGLLSVIGKNIKIRIKTMNDDVKILKCLAIADNASLKLNEIEPNSHYEIEILNDIQSEENKDLLFEISLPKLDDVNHEWNCLQVECEYFNIITNEQEKISTMCQIQRSAQESESTSSERNYEIDIQYNRIIATDAVKAAIQKGDCGDLKGAVKIIEDAKGLIEKSLSKNDSFCQSLLKDLSACIDGMQSKHVYESEGIKWGQTFMQTQTQQRAYQTESKHTTLYSLGNLSTATRKIWRANSEKAAK